MAINSQSVNGLEIADIQKGEISMCESSQSKNIQQRNEYIHNKMKPLDLVKDAHKHTRRLARIMVYHKLLTDVEVAYMRHRLHVVFGNVSLKGSEDV